MSLVWCSKQQEVIAFDVVIIDDDDDDGSLLPASLLLVYGGLSIADEEVTPATTWYNEMMAEVDSSDAIWRK